MEVRHNGNDSCRIINLDILFGLCVLSATSQSGKTCPYSLITGLPLLPTKLSKGEKWCACRQAAPKERETTYLLIQEKRARRACLSAEAAMCLLNTAVGEGGLNAGPNILYINYFCRSCRRKAMACCRKSSLVPFQLSNTALRPIRRKNEKSSATCSCKAIIPLKLFQVSSPAFLTMS